MIAVLDWKTFALLKVFLWDVSVIDLITSLGAVALIQSIWSSCLSEVYSLVLFVCIHFAHNMCNFFFYFRQCPPPIYYSHSACLPGCMMEKGLFINKIFFPNYLWNKHIHSPSQLTCFSTYTLLWGYWRGDFMRTDVNEFSFIYLPPYRVWIFGSGLYA